MDVADDLHSATLVVSTRRDGARRIVSLAGELDLDTADTFRTAISDLLVEQVSRVEVDAGGLGFADSAGLRALLLARSAAEAAGASFGVTVASPAVSRVIEITGLTDLFADGA